MNRVESEHSVSKMFLQTCDIDNIFRKIDYKIESHISNIKVVLESHLALKIIKEELIRAMTIMSDLENLYGHWLRSSQVHGVASCCPRNLTSCLAVKSRETVNFSNGHDVMNNKGVGKENNEDAGANGNVKASTLKRMNLWILCILAQSLPGKAPKLEADYIRAHLDKTLATTHFLYIFPTCSVMTTSGNFLSSSLDSRSSFLWCNLLEGRNFLSLSLRHRISNGLSTNISHDKWIPALKKLTLSPYHSSRGPERMVSKLIDYNQCCWREDKIQFLFLHHEAEAILNIPLNPAWPEDQLLKSGYKIGMEFMNNNASGQGTSSTEAEGKIWNLIHNLQVQPKIRMFLWRATSDILSTRRNLFKRRPYKSVACVYCGHTVEDDRHALFNCKFSQKVWTHLPKCHKWNLLPSTSFEDLIYSIVIEHSIEELALFGTTAWLI
ncbi:hypothetical protein M9H77_09527 [Catharanthus roseus]|uniref:Uncharacterized protein n=1 Tax=Catharanthus roseus TaxID=4058 RepID=A0ACC0C0U9_CATRO|nr:hypothetical protein M9H77_09527 [Catharanthus roseus]